MIQLRGNHTTEDRRLDRLPSETDEHIRKYPLRAPQIEQLAEQPSPMVAGVNWYTECDRPERVRVGRRTVWMIGHKGLTRIRGGHAFALPNYNMTADASSWWPYYDQGSEGRCVHFGVMRAGSLIYRVKFDIDNRTPYFDMQRTDEWDGGSYPGAQPVYEGTSVNAGLRNWLQHGQIPVRSSDYDASKKIPEFRWATRWEDVRAATNTPDDMPGVYFHNSWGRDYPHRTVLHDDAGTRMLAEDGEFGIVVRR
jgi:hypothetical protein